MTTRAKEIAAEGPYKIVSCGFGNKFWYTQGPTGEGKLTKLKVEAEEQADDLNAAYKQGQQDRWISVEERLPEPNIEVLVAFADDTVAGTSQWCRVKSPDIMGWLGPAENKGKVITHWMPLPSPSNPEQR